MQTGLPDECWAILGVIDIAFVASKNGECNMFSYWTRWGFPGSEELVLSPWIDRSFVFDELVYLFKRPDTTSVFASLLA